MSKSRRKIDTWKIKKWIDIYAPENLFKNMKIGETPALKEEQVIGRKVEISLFDLTGDYQHDQIKIIFKVADLENGKAKTVFDREFITNTYLRSLVRRGTSRIDAEVKARTTDNYLLQLFGVVFTNRKVINSIRRKLRRVMREELQKFISEHTLNDIFSQLFIKEPDNFVKDLISKLNKIALIRRFEVRKTVVLSHEELPQAS